MNRSTARAPIEKMTADPGIQCRKNVVVLFTDGGESCIRDNPRDALAGTRALLVVYRSKWSAV